MPWRDLCVGAIQMFGKVSADRRRIMAQVRARDTGPELKLRAHLSKSGLRYRLYKSGVPGRPDIVFVREKVAIFCDGDFWHGKGWKRRKAQGQFKVRRKYWIEKIEENIRRDRRVNRRLKTQGWVVMRYWESEIETQISVICLEIKRVLVKRRRIRGLGLNSTSIGSTMK